jgi:predicted alpha/beta-fold hydrolase
MFLQQHEAEGAAPSWRSTRACSTARPCWQARDLYEFDNVFTAPLHGFRDTADYWSRGSAKPHLASIRVPALVVNARNDPFIPAGSLPGPGEVGAHVTLWQPAQGGHVGFPVGPPPGHVRGMPERVGNWLRLHGGTGATSGISADGAGLPPVRE